jgi:hypothetical protein
MSLRAIGSFCSKPQRGAPKSKWARGLWERKQWKGGSGVLHSLTRSSPVWKVSLSHAGVNGFLLEQAKKKLHC